jgi:beta-mannosidase
MANTTWFSWGPGDTFHASVQAISDTVPISKARMEARILDRSLRTVATKIWTVDLPGKEKPTPGRQIKWAIPRDTPDSYFFLVVSLRDSAGRRLSQQTYWMRTLGKLADPVARGAWQAKAEPDPVCDKGPWLRPQLASLPTSLQMRITSATSDGKQARVMLVVKNTGTRPAFPVRISVSPGLYSSIWSDNFIWIEPGESRTLVGTIRVDMAGMDPVAKPNRANLEDLIIECGAWNTPTARLRAGRHPLRALQPRSSLHWSNT